MIYLRQTLKTVHQALSEKNIPHSLIGGFALSCYGSTRATSDIDFLIHENDRKDVEQVLLSSGFKLDHQTEEVMQFSGIGFVDFLIARRPLSQKMILDSNRGGPENVSYVKPEDFIALKIQAYKNNSSRRLQDQADIQFIVKNVPGLDFNKIKEYADMFGEWEVILAIRNKA